MEWFLSLLSFLSNWLQSLFNRKYQKKLLHSQRVKEALDGYNLRTGSPKKIIDTYTDLTQEEKAAMYEEVIRIKKEEKAKTILI